MPVHDTGDIGPDEISMDQEGDIREIGNSPFQVVLVPNTRVEVHHQSL